MLDRVELENRLKGPGYGMPTVQAIIASKQYKRSKKSQDLQMYTMDLLNPRLSKWSQGEKVRDRKKEDAAFGHLADFLYNLAQEKEQPLRFQLMVKSTAGIGHFSAVDIEISKEGIKFLNYDSAGLDTFYTSEGPYMLFEKLAKKFPPPNEQCVFYRFNPENRVQADEHSCTVFSLDALFHLSNMETFRILADRTEELIEHDRVTSQNTVTHGRVIDLPQESIPADFAVLYRNTQSLKRASEFPTRFSEHVINKKGQTLIESVSYHTGEKFINYKSKLANLAVEHKRAGYTIDVLNAYDQNPEEFIKNVASRDIFEAIESEDFYSLSSSKPSSSSR